MKEIIKVLKITRDTVRGDRMIACAGSIDWAIKELEKLSSKQKENDLKDGGTKVD